MLLIAALREFWQVQLFHYGAAEVGEVAPDEILLSLQLLTTWDSCPTLT